ncbi:MAG: pyridoxal-phosphate dependent enzyme [Flavobacteriaceae bacterium]|nr:pyridoxal-phosphate dependent enzyme [Flavobacteriaceae bacterium]
MFFYFAKKIKALFIKHKIIKNQQIPLELFSQSNYSVYIKREDLLHPEVSGNKFRKLKYNLLEAKKLGFDKVLTFGGAYSNHISATAAAGKELSIKTIGIIRGEELSSKIAENPTLSFAEKCGMELYFISRSDYRKKTEPEFITELKEKYGSFYLVPEGGTNKLAVKGCKEILTKSDVTYDYICTAVGTGGTIAGLVEASKPHQTIIGFSALKGVFQKSEIEKYTSKKNYQLIDDYCFGGYAKIDEELIRFINEFKENTGIPIDPVYTGKMMFGIMDLIEKNYFKENSSILAIHTGGLQGISGMNQLLKKKNLPQIKL